MALTVGSCFSGIGGIELGLEMTGGFRTIWQIENDPYATKVLASHWPDVKRYGDIRAVDPAGLERPDLICGGYPCQPFSLAGKRRGTNDDRHLWPEMLRIIRHLRPRLLLLENVPGHLSMGFSEVLGALAESGYDAEWDCLPAAAVGAPHRRDRLFVVAHANGRGQPVQGRPPWESGFSSFAREVVAHADGARLKHACQVQTGSERIARRDAPSSGGWWDNEPNVGRVAHGIPFRVDRLKGLGNAVVPQVAKKIGEMILELERTRS